jgi:LysM repeat protein
MPKLKPQIVILVMLTAIVLAVALSLAFFMLWIRPQYPPGAYLTTIDGVEILVEADPAQQVRLVPEETQFVQPGDQGGQVEQQQPTAVPPSEPTATPLPPPTATPRPDPVIFIDFVVQQGATLYGISASRENTSIALMARYGIDAYDLQPGRTIRLPIGNPAYCATGRPYAVGEGDTVYNIGKRFNTTPDRLKELNVLNDDYLIRVAEIICLPNP